MISQIAGDTTVRPGMHVFVDARDVASVGSGSVDASVVVLRLLKANQIDRVAAYVENDGVERALLEVGVRVQQEGIHLRVFRDRESALAWLDQPERGGR